MSVDCSLHSWSDTNDEKIVGYTWSACCYKGSKEGKCMWSKSSEIKNQTLSKLISNDQTANKGRKLIAPSLPEKLHTTIGEISKGFEISIGPKNTDSPFEKYKNATAKMSLERWKKSPKHLEVIINEGKWKKVKWKKIGAASYGPFANVWFSE